MKFDVVLGNNPPRFDNDRVRFVFDPHTRNHLRLIADSGYYVCKVRNEQVDTELFIKINDELTHISTTPINEKADIRVWQK